MRFRPIAFLTASLMCLAFPGSAEAAITITEAPSGMRKQSADITLGWTGGKARVHLRASTVSGGGVVSRYDSLHLPSQLDAGTYTFRVNPDIPIAYRNTDLRLGVNYCILSDGTQASPEFIIIIESANAPVLTSPASAASIKDLTPTFSWTGDAPFYALLVSDEPFKITAEGTVTGVSAIWQIITPYTTVRYGSADPSGFNSVPAPPLISGKTYNWLVLNNYGNNSASTSKVAPVPNSFVYSPAPPLATVQLLEPRDRDTVAGTDRITFRWALVDGAVSYKVELLEENLVDGSQADIALWKTSSIGGQVSLDNATGLLRRFNYKWRVYAIGNNGSASLSDKRSFFYDVAVGDISISVKNQAGQKIAYAPVRLNRLGGASSAVYQGGSTDNEGVLSIKNAPLGNYEARIENLDGYQSRIDTIAHTAGTGSTRNITLLPVLGRILGKVSAAGTGTGILNARITVTGSGGSEWTTVTNSQGNYSLGLPYGNWQVLAHADGYAASAASTASLSATTASRSVDIALPANKFTLSGTVQNSFTRQGVFGATVYLTAGGATRSVNTDGNGSFSFSVAAGAMSLRISSPGFASPEPLSVSVDGDKTLGLTMDPNASILSGRTRDASGTALPGALVLATPRAGPVRSAVSDNLGSYELSLPAGDWILGGSAKGYTSRSAHKFLLDVSKTVQGVDFTFDANRSSVAGRVTVNGAGLAAARVSAGDASTLSDNSGYYLLSVNAGTHSVSAAKDGYLSSKVYAVPVNAGDTVSGIDFAVSGNAGIVKGRALAGGAGVAGALIRAVNQSNREAFQTPTDNQGGYSLSLPGAGYQVQATKEGFALEQILSFTLPAGGSILDADLRLIPDQGSVTGVVAGGGGALGGCEVSYRNDGGSGLSGKTVTDPQGRYSLSLQAGSPYTVTASCAGYQAASAATASLPRGGALTQDFNLAKAGAIYLGKVVDSKGAALAGAKLTAEKSGIVVQAMSDFSGGFTLSLGAGTYVLAVSKTGYRQVSRALQLALGENRAAAPDTLFASVGRLSGRVTSDGPAVPGALVTLAGLSPEAGSGAFTTDAEGRFGGDGLPAGTYGLTAGADGFTESRIASLTVTAGGSSIADIALTANRGILSGTASLDGVPAADVSVTANAYGISRSTVSASDGKYRIDKLPAGVFSVSVSRAGYSADKVHESQSLSANGSLAGLDFNLIKNAGSLSGTVTGAASASGIRVSAAGKKGARAYAVCDGAGRFTMASIPADTYALSVAAPGYKLAGASQSPEITVTGVTEYNPALVPAVFRLSGRILDQGGAGLAGLPVELRIGADRMGAVSGADGAYAFADVPAGLEYQLAVKPPTADYDARDTTFALALSAPAQITADLHTLSRLAVIGGAVFLDDVAVEGASIKVAGNGNNIATLSQPSGQFKVMGIAGGSESLKMTVSRPGANSVDTAFALKPGEIKAGMALKLRTLKLALTVSMSNSEGRPLAGAKLVASSSARLDTVTADAEGKVAIAGIPGNQSLTLATHLDKDRFDNAEAAVFLKEKDTSASIVVRIHATTAAIEVKDQDGAALDGADVLMNGKNLGKTSQGKVTARFLGRGEYRFAAGKPGYKSGPEKVLPLSGDTSVTVALSLARVVGGLYGTVSDSGFHAASGVAASKPLPGAVVTAVSAADTLQDTVDASGQYSFPGLAAGAEYSVSLSLPGYFPVTEMIVGNPVAQQRDLRLRPLPGSVSGRVDNGRSGIKVTLFHAASGQVSTFRTRTGGYYGFSGLRNRNDYSVQAVDGALSSQGAPFLADGAAAKRIDPVLEGWGGVEGSVSGGAASPGVPVAGALVAARNGLSGASAWCLSDSAGLYAIPGLAAGGYEITVARKGYRSTAPVTVAVPKGIMAQGAFFLEETDAGIAGVIADASGQGLAAQVVLERLAGPTGGRDTLRFQAEGNGQFVFGGLAEGGYRLSASKSGFAAFGPVDVAYDGKGIKTRNIVMARRADIIQGVVRDALTNTPVAGARVALNGGAAVSADSLGRYEIDATGAAATSFLDAAMDGYLPRSGLAVFPDGEGSATQDIVLAADYKFDGEIAVTVTDGGVPVPGLFLTVQSFHPDDSLKFSLTGPAPNSFRGLRRPVPYTIKVKREGYGDLARIVEMTAKDAVLNVALSYPSSRIRVFVTSDGKRGKGVDVALNGRGLRENPDTSGLYAGAAKMDPGGYEVAIKDREADLIPLAPYFIALGEDSVRTDTLSQPFFRVPIADSILGSSFAVMVRREDSIHPAAAVTCSLYYRPEGDPAWKALALDSAAGGFSGMLPAQEKPGAYEYHFAIRSPAGARIGTVTPATSTVSTAALAYTDVQTPGRFTLRDPFLLQSMALLPQRLEADTSLYSLGARDLFQAVMRGENGRSLDARFDERAAAGDTAYSVAFAFADPAKAAAYGLKLTPDPESPRLCRFSGGAMASDSVFRIECSVRMGAVRLRKPFHIKIQDLAPVSIGIKYVKENRVLEKDGASLLLSNRSESGYQFTAFATTKEGRVYNISPAWTFAADSSIGSLSQAGLFRPNPDVARGAGLLIFDTLVVATTNSGTPIYGAFSFLANVATFAQVSPASSGRAVVSNGEGAFLDFNLAGLSKAFTVSVKKPKVSGLLRSSPREEVVGDILDIELSESQPFKADSGAVMRLPVSQGIAQKRKIYLGHWNSARLSWDKVDSAQGGAEVDGKVYGFSKYAVLMGSLPLGAYDFIATPNPFTSEDPWGLQLGYKISSDVSSQVGVRVEVYNMMGDKVYESQEVQLSKGDNIQPGTRRAAVSSPERKSSLAPFVWDGHDSRGVACRNGRYMIKLIVRDGQGKKEYLKKVVMLK